MTAFDFSVDDWLDLGDTADSSDLRFATVGTERSGECSLTAIGIPFVTFVTSLSMVVVR